MNELKGTYRLGETVIYQAPAIYPTKYTINSYLTYNFIQTNQVTFHHQLFCSFKYLVEMGLLKILEIMGATAYNVTYLNDKDIVILHD